MADEPIIPLKQKALSINLDDKKYGAFAEIGAGQEVVRHFFQAGGAAGTVAFSTSAYDMTFSDSLYGKRKGERYVSQSRLKNMLRHEFDTVRDQLTGVRDKDSTFFAFANTVSARNYHGTNDCHGWLGIRFQACPNAEPSDIILHCRLFDDHSVLQYETIGAIGVNLIYAAFHYLNDPDKFIASLFDNIDKERAEIDMIEFVGPHCAHVNNRLANLSLVQRGLTDAILFDADGSVQQPADLLYKQEVIIQRGSFKPVTHVNVNMQECAIGQYQERMGDADSTPMLLMEISLNNLSKNGDNNEMDYCHRIDLLTALGYRVLISNFSQHFQFANYIAAHSKRPFALVLGIDDLEHTFHDVHYEELDGGILEAFGKLFAGGGKLFIYPRHNADNDCLQTADNLEVAPYLQPLYQYLLENKFIVPLEGCDVSKLHIYSRDVHQMIVDGKPDWEQHVPGQVVEIIKDKKLWQ
jgi:hypothetical protein